MPISSQSPPAPIAAHKQPFWLSHIRLTNFRVHQTLSLSLPSPAPIILTGANGAGKTSLLEAISLLGSGRGLRMARADQIIYSGSNQSLWSIAAKLCVTENAVHRISVGCQLDKKPASRMVRLNGRNVSSITLAQHFSLFWLTPPMARLFSEGSDRTYRRRFMDRLVIGLFADHAKHLSGFDRARRQRQRILETAQHSAEWLTALETQMARHAFHILEARANTMAALNREMKNLKPEGFPEGKLSIAGDFETGFSEDQAETYAAALAQNRNRDRAAGRTLIGPHQADFILTDLASGQLAGDCSTGEVKALLTGLTFAAAQLAQNKKAAPPIILLDEIAAHLDEKRRTALFNCIAEWPGQIWMTGTDRDIFSRMKMIAHFFTIQPGRAQPS